MRKIIFAILTTLIGILAGIFSFELYILFSVIISIGLILIMLFSVFTFFKKKSRINFKKIFFQAGMLILLYFSMLVGYEIVSSITLNKAKLIKEEIEEFNNNQNYYPKNLEVLNISNLNAIYKYDKTNNTYILLYKINGNIFHAYNSEFQNWYILD